MVGVDGDAFVGIRVGEANQYLQKELYLAVRGILYETAAYREYVSRAKIESLFEEK